MQPYTEWKAQWIGVDDAALAAAPNRWFCFRKRFQCATVPNAANCRIAVDSKYWLWVNGTLVVYEGGLKRGPTPEDTYFDQLDLSSYLQVGENQIAVLVWHFGKSGFSHNDSGTMGLLFELDLAAEAICSDSSWKVSLHPAYGDTDEPHPNRRLSESNTRFDVQRDLPGWTTSSYDAAAWGQASELGCAPCAPWCQLYPRPIPLWKDYGSGAYESITSETLDDGRLRMICRLPYNAHISPILAVDAPAGCVVDIRADNYEGGGELNLRAEYVTRAGEQEFELLPWLNGHEILYTMPPEVMVLSLSYRETGYNTKFSGTFSCEDAFLNRLREKAVRTLHITMRDTYMDCPDRERAQWWGDAVNELGEAFYALDCNSHALAKKGILELMRWQSEDGSIHSPIPGNYTSELPMQMLASVGFFGFWTYYVYSGDSKTLEAVYPRVRRYVLDVWSLLENGLVVERPGGWTWGDWGVNRDMSLLYNVWYVIALQGLREMALLFDYPDDAHEAQARIDSIGSRFDETFWTGTEFRSPGHEELTDDRGNALAVVAGLVDAQKYPHIREVLRTHYHASPYMEKYVLEALYLMRYEEDAIARIHKRFGPMVESELTTLWEGWGIGRDGFGGGTINHAWSGGALTIMSQYIAGIAPDVPGFARYHVLPQLGPLQDVQANVTTVRGDIRIQIRRTDKQVALSLVSPDGTHARVGLPKAGFPHLQRVECNGVDCWHAEKLVAQDAGVTFDAEDDHYLYFHVPAGTWAFVAHAYVC